jgi:hypothetical protein
MNQMRRHKEQKEPESQMKMEKDGVPRGSYLHKYRRNDSGGHHESQGDTNPRTSTTFSTPELVRMRSHLLTYELDFLCRLILLFSSLL